VPLDADVIEMMLVSTLHHLLLESAENGAITDVTEPFEGHWTEAPERQQIRDAVLTGDEAVLDLSIERMVARVVPELALQRRAAATRQQARQLELERRFDAWAEVPDGPRTSEMRAETRALNQLLREWFSEIHVANTTTDTVFRVWRRPGLAATRAPGSVEVRLDRREWARASRARGGRQRRPAAWSDDEILVALRRAPTAKDWVRAAPHRPCSRSVTQHFGSFRAALAAAGLADIDVSWRTNRLSRHI
jgi:hypothetical protein